MSRGAAKHPPIVEIPSPNYSNRREGACIDILLLHYTGMISAAAAIERLCNPEAKVSAHYVIDEDGVVYRLLPEGHRGHHAGISFWSGERDINSRSIGIEIVNPGHEHGYRDFPQAQMKSVLALGLDIASRHPIPPERVLGHSDVAPTRKEDPGELFPWQWLAANGLGLWPQSGCTAPDEGAETLLMRYGYETGADAVTRASIVAFQRHFRPERMDGLLDGECHLLLGALCTQAEVLDTVR